MKKTLIALALVGFAVSSAHAAVEASAVATWQATAKKDTSSDLVVTPLGSLAFQYAEGIKGFNTVNGLFDVTVQGHSGTTEDPITAFTLKAKKLSGTLNHLGGGSTVDVGVFWMGQPVAATAYTTLINTTAGINGGNLSPLAQGFNVNGQRASAQGAFSFNIDRATVNGTNAALTALPDGMWTGEVSVEFVANWA
ncbi:common pilus major fimbrillin subunit EcpA [Aeromonas salmonicida]|uniref:common pilus major fimbrillin subunit EcpA n=1 Tax=Aeromonas salmonicida TaxID=645 RepID=UPI001F41A2FC|nr:common pilus major fimbrillin subunit EcpA [Aeromonas salmonicida]MCE9935553.1 common pilus major fimbrillin subunit EcpA [Aeromonas salmonicida]